MVVKTEVKAIANGAYGDELRVLLHGYISFKQLFRGGLKSSR
jgi:hypothetical protein